MNWISKSAALLIAACAALTLCGGGSPPKIVVRVHTQNVAKEMKGNQTFMVQIPDPPEQISVMAIPEASEKDVLNVVAKPVSHGFGAYIQFNRRASVNISATTAQNQDRILVVVINNRVVYAPKIDTVISNGVIHIPEGITPKEMQALGELAKYNTKRAKF
ncbi:hypothetical protein DB346_22545 [Verrucomicrobia bacterium LW23]|nr:hypothetical protein DB346_22545 [Verrucomicrobia bacterium LW23]